MSSAGTAGLVTMKASTVFPQSTSHLPAQHTQTTVLQPANAFSQQIQQQQQQQQHLLQQQQQQRVQQQHTQAQQHAHLHRLSQPHVPSSSLHPVQSTVQTPVVNNTAQASVFPNADFFQTLQQTAAALPTVLPYDQSQYFSPIMYFPYQAAAAANGLFGTSAPVTDAHHMTAGVVSSTQGGQGAQATIISQASSQAASQLIGGASIVSATPNGMVTLNQTGTSGGQVQNAGHFLAPGTSIVGIGTGANNPSASLAPLFTTAHFYPQQQHSQPSALNQTPLQLSHALQPHSHGSIQMQHVQPLATGHTAIPGQAQQASLAAATLLPPGSLQSAVSQIGVIASQANQLHVSIGNGTSQNTNTNNNSSNGTGTDPTKNEDSVHSTPNQTPIKQSADADQLVQTTQLTNQSQNSGSGLELTSASTKRDNNGTGHFVCNVCGREFGMRCRLIAHTRRHTGERPFPCADCGRAFSDRGNLQRHRYTHSSQPRFHCSVCGKSFRQASCLSNHRRFHCAGATGRPCPFCQRSFRSSSSLQMHIRWKHRADAAAAVAAAAAAAAVASSSSSISDAFTNLPGLCTYATSTPTMNGIPTLFLNGGGGTIDRNDSISTSTVANCSSESPALFTPQLVSASGINATSTGSPNKRKWRRKPKPKQPQNAFGKLTGDGLNILAGINLSDVNAAAAAAGAAAAAVGGPVPLDRKGRPCNFPCPACPRRFAFQCRLAAHLRCHTNIRPFICIDCGRAFTQRGYLVRHAAVHKLDRPFSCGICDRSYKHYGSLVNHRRTHNKLSGSGFGNNVALLTSMGMIDHLGCDTAVVSAGVGALSSLEEVVGGTLEQSDKLDVSDSIGVTSAASTTLTLLPVTKVEEVLPGDISCVSSMQQVCVPSVACAPGTGLGSLINQQSQQSVSETLRLGQAQSQQSVPHQLTATAVWPILGQAPQAHLVAFANTAQSQPVLPSSHFSGLTNSPNQTGAHTAQQLIPAPQQQRISQSGNLATGTPTFVTVSRFGATGPQQPESEESAAAVVSNQHAQHHQFHGGATPLVSTASPVVSDSSSSPPQQQHHQHPQASQQIQPHPSSGQHHQQTADTNNTPVLHVLQPSPSIFLSPYYLPHTATSQMQ